MKNKPVLLIEIEKRHSKKPVEETIDKMAYIRNLRKDYVFQIFFTIDAGSNLHLICEEKNQEKYKNHIAKDFPHIPILIDHIGQGPTLKAYHSQP